MKQMLKGFFSAVLLLSVVTTARPAETESNDVWGKPFFAQRPQVNNYNRFMAGWAHNTHVFDADCLNGALAIVPGYQATFNATNVGKYFSPNNLSNSFVVGPSNLTGVDVINTNFLLGDEFSSTVKLSPRSQNAFVNVDFFLGLDEWVCGLWFEMHAPINWTRWNLDVTETTTSTATSILQQVLAPAAVTSPFTDFVQAWKGLAAPASSDVKAGLAQARVDGRQSKWALADLELALGYDFINNECSHLGVSFRVIAPTGNRPDGEFVFEPISGSGKHTQVGGGVTGHYEFWNNCCDSSFGVYFYGAAYTMLKAKQTRTFDWTKNGKWSRYLLLKQFNSDNTFAGVIVPSANITTLKANVKVAVNGEGVIMFDWKRCGLTIDVGFDIWGRSKEKITITSTFDESVKYQIKGSALVGANNTNTLVEPTATIKSENGNNQVEFATVAPLTIADLDVAGAAAPSALSYKVFAHLAYTWEDCDYMPFLGVGGEAEFSGRNNAAFNQWAVWVKGGFSFL
jgi:hypothetical protein